jgi:hypothetical protein
MRQPDLEKKCWRPLEVFTAILVVLLSITGALWAASSDHARMTQQLGHALDDIKEHESRLRQIEGSIGSIQTDVGWIRETMEGKTRNPNPEIRKKSE